MSREIVVIDYHKGNLKSVERGLIEAGATARITDDPSAIAGAAGLVLPGVGSFADAMNYLRGSGQADQISLAIRKGVPFLGICLGLQLLLDEGDEGANPDALAPIPGLGVIGGTCARIESRRLKVPHVGWDTIDINERGRACPLLTGVDEGATMYFTHSYAAADDIDPDAVCARTHYGRSFASVVWRDNVYACQFHPEKSSRSGLRILENFTSLVAGGR